MPTLPPRIVSLIQTSNDDSKLLRRRIGSLPDAQPDTIEHFARYRAIAKSDRRIEGQGVWGTVWQADEQVERFGATYPGCDVYIEILYGFIERYEGG